MVTRSPKPPFPAALTRALRTNDAGAVERLAARTGPSRISALRQDGHGGVSLACEYDAPEALAAVLRHGADPNAISPPGDRLDVVAHCAAHGKLACLEVLLAHGARVSSLAVVGASHAGHVECLRRLLAAAPDVIPPDHTANLMEGAVCAGHVECLEVLLAHGFALTGIDWFGRTPLLQAAEHGAAACLRLLLAHGADPNDTTRNGTTALAYAAEAVPCHDGPDTPDFEGCLAALIAHGADVNDVNATGRTGLSALHFAARRGRTAQALMLLNAGAQTTCCDESGYTPGALAAASGYGELAQAIRSVERRRALACAAPSDAAPAPQDPSL